MHKQETAALNQHALAERMQALGLKQWWLADQIAVDKRTVNRWLTGRVRRISRDNLERLAAQLKCSEDELVLADETDTRATQKEQQQASQMLLDPAAQLMFAMREEYSLYESLIKAVMHPNMSIAELCRIYAKLTKLAASQEQREQAARYAKLALQYAIRCGDVEQEFSSRANLIAIDGENGKLVQARKALEELVLFAESIGNLRARAISQINLMHAQRLLGDMPAAIRSARQCLATFMSFQGKVDFSDRGALIHAASFAANIARDIRRFPLARRLRLYYQAIDNEEHTPRTIIGSALFVADVLSLEGREAEALALLDEHLEGFIALGRVQDGELIHPACVMRRAGRLKQAQEYLEGAQTRGKMNIYEPAFIAEEFGRIAAAAGDWRRARKMRREANQLFASFGMLKRCVDDPTLDTGQLFKAPSREKLEFEG
ncbi:helix-turn-helix transcriptional regulator [bacterium]|nr:helix-turn-helix transcriptional regulator [bacterium]